VQTCLHGCFNQDKRSASVISTNNLDILVLIDTKSLNLVSERVGGSAADDNRVNKPNEKGFGVIKTKKNKNYEYME
jgi:hypothetical protein